MLKIYDLNLINSLIFYKVEKLGYKQINYP